METVKNASKMGVLIGENRDHCVLVRTWFCLSHGITILRDLSLSVYENKHEKLNYWDSKGLGFMSNEIIWTRLWILAKNLENMKKL